VEEVGRYLLTVRAQYLFLMSLCKKYKENDEGIEDERRSFWRYCTFLSILVIWRKICISFQNIALVSQVTVVQW
jgi:hypothetical protein